MLTLPNILSIVRLVSLPILFILLHKDRDIVFLIAYILIGLTDYFDGFIARKLALSSSLGEKLDTLADIPFYFSTAYFMKYLYPERVRTNRLMIYVVLIIICIFVITSIKKKKKLIMPHTRLIRLTSVLAYLLIPFSYLLDTTYLISLVLILYALSFLEFCKLTFLSFPSDQE